MLKTARCICIMYASDQPGKEKTSILIGQIYNRSICFHVLVIVPFMKMESENDYEEFKDLLNRIWDWWDDTVDPWRIGETIYRLGMSKFLREVVCRLPAWSSVRVLILMYSGPKMKLNN